VTCQPFPVTVPAGAPGTTSGPADPYPLYLGVTGAAGIPTRAQIRLLGLSHTFPDDLDMLLVTPFGRPLWLMSDAGGSGDVSNLDITFDASAAPLVPDSGPLGAGPYHPADYETGDELPSPAPHGPYPTGPLPVTPANGSWELYVNDDAGADVGEIAGGFCLDLQLDAPGTYCSSGPLALVPNDPMDHPAGVRRERPPDRRTPIPRASTFPRKASCRPRFGSRSGT
jgi:hypothetical protein